MPSQRHGGAVVVIMAAVVVALSCQAQGAVAVSSSSSWQQWWHCHARPRVPSQHRRHLWCCQCHHSVMVGPLSLSSWRWWWWHHRSVTSLNSMPASRSGHHHCCAWRVAQQAGGLGNKSAVGLSENFNLTLYWYSYTSLNQVFVNFCWCNS